MLQDMLQFLQRQTDPPVLGTIRAAQRIFLRANQKFPDYIEIGIGGDSCTTGKFARADTQYHPIVERTLWIADAANHLCATHPRRSDFRRNRCRYALTIANGDDLRRSRCDNHVVGDSERLLRLEQEARATAAINHPNILAVYDIGQHDGSPYIVAELLQGKAQQELAGLRSLHLFVFVEILVRAFLHRTFGTRRLI